MIVSLIAAIGKNRELGLNNQMLWHIPEDFKHFKMVTMGHHLLMGRKTYESIGRPLPGRTTIIVTRNSNWAPATGLSATVKVVGQISEAIQLARQNGESELFVCGGGQVYEQTLGVADKFYLSQVDYQGEADTYFPEFNVHDYEIVEEKTFPAREKTPSWTWFELAKK